MVMDEAPKGYNPVQNIEGEKVVKILIVRIGRVGDMLMITPAMEALLELYPEAEFHMLTSADGVRVFKGYSPRLTRFLTHQRKSLLPQLALRRLKKQIDQEGYDYAFCFEYNETFLKLIRGAGQAYGMSLEGADSRHYCQLCLDVVERAAGRSVGEHWLNLPVTDEARRRSREILAEAGLDDKVFIVGIHPTYSGMKKVAWRRHMDEGRRWPPEAFACLGRLISDYGESLGLDIRVIMDLLPDEQEVGEQIVRLSEGKVQLLIPPLDFQRYKATLERMDLLVTPDTGPMHVAGAVGTPLVALFGGTRPDDSGPYVPPERRQLIQAPDQKIAHISPEQVFEACKPFLPARVSNVASN